MGRRRSIACAGASLAISDIPFHHVLGGVRVALVGLARPDDAQGGGQAQQNEKQSSKAARHGDVPLGGRRDGPGTGGRQS